MKVFCIILARGGSKQIKNKNLVKIKSKPMIYYTISQALNSKMVSQVWFHLMTERFFLTHQN